MASSRRTTNGDARSIVVSRASSPCSKWGSGLYFTATVAYAASRGLYGSLPFLLLFQAGFLYTGILSLRERFERGAQRIGTARGSTLELTVQLLRDFNGVPAVFR